MTSIVLSFVGNQDPVSGDTDREGSIVTLVKHLVSEGLAIDKVLLLHTKTTAQGAIDTQEWLVSELQLAAENIEIIPVSEALSEDPVNLLLAVEAVKDLLVKAQGLLAKGGRLEFNASSGTPAMKSVWGILQAAGYAPNSNVWQVRNPKEMSPGQNHVFATDMGVLRTEFDRNVIQQQLADYNYSGALATIRASSLCTPLIEALLQYGHSRSAFDFERAALAIKSYRNAIAPELVKDIDLLRQANQEMLLKDVYFVAEIMLKNLNYCDFLIAVAQFQENSLRLLLSNVGLAVPKRGGWDAFWTKLRGVDEGNLYRYLTEQQAHNKNLRNQREVNNPTMIEILRYFNDPEVPIEAIEKLKNYCTKRNDYIHRLEGVSEIPEAQAVLANTKTILRQLTKLPEGNSFDRLNREILAQIS
jgi:hypothetical protein